MDISAGQYLMGENVQLLTWHKNQSPLLEIVIGLFANGLRQAIQFSSLERVFEWISVFFLRLDEILVDGSA